MDLKQEFERIVGENIHRDGIVEFIDWLRGTDFFTAPASTRYHGCHEGGLLLHSLNVYAQLNNLCRWYGCPATKETITLVSLFHDVCKAGCYKVVMRWRKNQQDKWEQYPTYEFKEDFAYGGHGSKSVFLIQSFMQLSSEEAAAINCHMGQWDSTTYSNPTEVYCRSMLAWLLHVADEAADFLMETKKEE